MRHVHGSADTENLARVPLVPRSDHCLDGRADRVRSRVGGVRAGVEVRPPGAEVPGAGVSAGGGVTMGAGAEWKAPIVGPGPASVAAASAALAAGSGDGEWWRWWRRRWGCGRSAPGGHRLA